MPDLVHDLRYALRDLRRRPVFALAALATLALGIGANVLVFTLVEGVLLRPLPYPEPERLVEVWNTWRDQTHAPLAFPELRAYGESGSLAAIAGFAQSPVDLSGDGDAERVTGAYAGCGIFAVLGVEPILGRGFTADDDRPGSPPVVVLGHELWSRRFGADPAVLGRTLRLDGVEAAIVGVLPPGVRLPGDHRTGARTELWLPLQPFLPPDLLEHWGMHFLSTVARLDHDVSLHQAQAEIDLLVRRLAASGVGRGNALEQDAFRVALRPVHGEVTEGARRPLQVLLVAVGLVLAIACANVANLELARGRGRRRELALRTALGASRRRLVRQLLVESALLASLGGALGVALAAIGLRLVVAAAPAGIPRLADVRLDAGVLAFATAVVAATAVGFGLLPALAASRPDLMTGLRTAAGATVERGAARSGRPLIAIEVALAVLLATGAGLLARTLLNLARVDPGFEVETALALDLAPPETAYPDGPELDAVFRHVREEIATLPGVIAVGAVSHLPLGSRRGDWNFYPEGRAAAPDEPTPRADWQVVTPGYLEALGVRLVEGRALGDGDDHAAPPVLLVNQALQRRYWPEESPLGRRVRLGGNDQNPLVTIVGVVSDTRSEALDREPVPEIYLPRAQATASMGSAAPRQLTITVRTAGDPARSRDAVRAAVRRVDAELAVAGVRTLAEVRARSLGATRFATVFLGGFAALAMALGAIGIYGVVSHLAAARRREIGIRMALGAARPGVLAMVLGQGLRPALLGIAIGLVLALAATRALEALLFGVAPADPATFLGVIVVFVGIAAAACYGPARRASALDPAAVLRED